MAYEQGTYQGSGQSRSGYTPTSRTKLQTINPRPNSGGPATLKWGEIGGQKTQGGGGLNLGGLFNSLGSAYAARKAAQIARENREWQAEQNTLAYERSLPWSSYGPAGNVEFDPETKEILQTLSPEFQGLMDDWLGVAGMAQQEMLGVMGDPYKMEREQFDRFERLNAPAYAQQRWAQKEQALAQGMQGTESYYDQMAVEDAIGRDRMMWGTKAMGTGMDYRNMLRAEALGFGEGAGNIPGLLTNMTTSGIESGQGSNVAANMLGVQAGGENLADTESAFWSSMLDQGAKYNSQTGVKTADAQQGLFNNLFNLGRRGYSMFTDDSTSQPQYGYSKIV